LGVPNWHQNEPREKREGVNSPKPTGHLASDQVIIKLFAFKERANLTRFEDIADIWHFAGIADVILKLECRVSMAFEVGSILAA
jgi:hypothetical protein